MRGGVGGRRSYLLERGGVIYRERTGQGGSLTHSLTHLTGGHIQQGGIHYPPDMFIPGSLEAALGYP